MLILDVPYKEKDNAKQIGAKWNNDLKKWVVYSYKDYSKFTKWIGDFNSVICDSIYIVEGKTNCWKCKKETPVIGIGIVNIVSLDGGDLYDKNIHILSPSEIFVYLPLRLQKYITDNYNIQLKYSKTVKSKYLANCCINCDSLQGDYFLFSEVDSPFFEYKFDKKYAEKLSFKKIKLQFDIPFNVSSWSMEDDNTYLFDIVPVENIHIF